MRLSDRHIWDAIQQQRIIVRPTPEYLSISGVTLDVRLGHQFRTFNTNKTPYVDLSAPKESLAATLDNLMNDEIILKDDDAFYLHPGELAIAVTYESITLPTDIVGWLDGRSSLARLGLMVHVTAHRIDPGWSGQIVLECYNSGQLPLALKPQMRIGALSFEQMTGPAEKPYNLKVDAKYRDQTGAVASRIDKDT